MSLPASDFCQRWRDHRQSWRHRSEGGFDARRYNVAPLAESDARTFVEANHYAASYPAARLRFGLYDEPWLVGVAVLGVPMQRRVLTKVFPDLDPYVESLELSRFVLAESVPATARVGSWPAAGRSPRAWASAAWSASVTRSRAVPPPVSSSSPATSAPSTRPATPSTSAGRRRAMCCCCPTDACSASVRCPRSAATNRGTPTLSASSCASVRGPGGLTSRARRGCGRRCRWPASGPSCTAGTIGTPSGSVRDVGSWRSGCRRRITSRVAA